MDIKRQIYTGIITHIYDVILNLFMLSYNALSVSNFESPFFESVLVFQTHLQFYSGVCNIKYNYYEISLIIIILFFLEFSIINGWYVCKTRFGWC